MKVNKQYNERVSDDKLTKAQAEFQDKVISLKDFVEGKQENNGSLVMIGNMDKSVVASLIWILIYLSDEKLNHLIQ